MKYFDLVPDSRRNSFRSKSIIVFGGAGFLGSHLCEKFLLEGSKVICVDNFQTGSRENIQHLLGHPMFSLIEHDIVNPLDMTCAVDEIYNMACPASPVGYQIDPIHTMMTNVLGAKNLLNLARSKGARILQSSTSEVYGDPEISLQSETYNGNVKTCGPRACYDEGKRAAETLFWEYQHLYGVQTRIARIFNTYGPRMSPGDGRVVVNFIMQALRGDPITVYGDGSQTRSFCYVTDLVEGLVRLMASDEVMPVNIGNPQEFTILELAKVVRKKIGAPVEIITCALPQDDPRQRRPDIARAKAILKWKPKISLSRGLDSMVEWYSETLFADKAVGAMV